MTKYARWLLAWLLLTLAWVTFTAGVWPVRGRNQDASAIALCVVGLWMVRRQDSE